MKNKSVNYFNPGQVYFAGVGPGDVELLTCKARKLIETADVILYAGSLINPEVLTFTSKDAVCHDTSKMLLADQIQIMISAAREGKIIARLHSGDPSIYGAISEQLAELRRAGITYHIIPGVSSAFAAAAALGIEYTVPEGTQTVIFSRQSGKTKVPERERLRYLGRLKSSLVIFLSTSLVDEMVHELKEAGYNDSTPVAFVYRASWQDEFVLRCTLGEIAEKIRAYEFTHQGLFIVSPALEDNENRFSYLYGGYQSRIKERRGIAIVTITSDGVKLGLRLLEHLENSFLYIPFSLYEKEQKALNHPKIILYKSSVRPVIQEAFRSAEGLICIMATGIVVREIAPMLQSKHEDPAVVVLDNKGNYAISLLSGHEGGANELAERIVKITGGKAIITTASDLMGVTSIDVFARQEGWILGEGSQLAASMAALVNGEQVDVVQECGKTWLKEPIPNTRLYHNLNEVREQNSEALFYIGLKKPPPWLLEKDIPFVFYHPKILVVGIGCNRNTKEEEIIEAIQYTLDEEQLSIGSIGVLATIQEKAREKGIQNVCKKFKWELRTVTAEEINALYKELKNKIGKSFISESMHAKKALGVWGVAEPAALLIAQQDHLLVSKKKFENVTVAIAVKRGSI